MDRTLGVYSWMPLLALPYNILALHWTCATRCHELTAMVSLSDVEKPAANNPAVDCICDAIYRPEPCQSFWRLGLDVEIEQDQ